MGSLFRATCGFSSGDVWMWELDCEEGWVPKNWCFWTVVLEKTLESPLDCKEIQPVHFKGDQSWVFFGRNDAEAETPVLWPPHVKSWLIGKDSDAGRDWGQEEKGTTGWDGWMASLTWWTWVWVNSGSWWWTGRPGVLRFMGSQSWTRLSDWTELKWYLVVHVCAQSLYLCPIHCNAMDCSHQAPQSMGFFRQEYWVGSHSLFQGIFLTQGSNSLLLYCRWILYCWTTGKALSSSYITWICSVFYS